MPDAVDVQLAGRPRNDRRAHGRTRRRRRARRFQIADRTWLLVVRDPNRPESACRCCWRVVGLALAALLGSLIFVWSRNERMQELQREASEDPLTGLKNRRRFDEDLRLAMARARRERTTGALLMLDLDHFKHVNDTYGHPAGDQPDRRSRRRAAPRTRASDILARLGGDEFAVILPRCTPEEARLAAEAIAAAIREHDAGQRRGRAGHRQHRRRDVRRPPAHEQRLDRLRGGLGDVRGQGRRPRRVRIFDRQAIRDDAPAEV